VPVAEVEHVEQGPCLLAEGLRPDAWEVPVVLDEPEDRGLVGERPVDVVLLGSNHSRILLRNFVRWESGNGRPT